MFRSATALVLGSAAVLVCGGALYALTPPLAPQEGILVLRNGHVLEGRITRVGDRFMVALGGNGEACLQAAEVKHWCRDLTEAYELQCEQLPAGSANARLQLAEWCLQHKMLSRAAEQLIEARRLDPETTRGDVLERRLQLAAHRRDTPTSSSTSRVPTPSTDEVAISVGQLPARAVQAYTTTIQPLLLNRCAANACHGSGSDTRLRLSRGTGGDAVPRRVTQRNLHVVMQMVNRDQPAESPLLTIPLAPHGNLPHPIFENRHSVQYQYLASWVQQVVSPPPVVPQTNAKLNPILRQAGEWPPAAHADRSGYPQPGKGEARSPTGSSPWASAARDRVSSRWGPQLNFVPRDPFDPELFNRHFFPRDRRDPPPLSQAAQIPPRSSDEQRLR